MLTSGGQSFLDLFLAKVDARIRATCSSTNCGIESRPRNQRDIIRECDVRVCLEHLDINIFEDALREAEEEFVTAEAA